MFLGNKQKETFTDIILKHLHMYITMRKCIWILYNKSLQGINNHKQNISKKYIQEFEKREEIREIIAKVQEQKTNFKYYHRKVSKQIQDQLFSLLILSLAQICSKPHHHFYSDRKMQFLLIRDTVVLLNFLVQKFKEHHKLTQIDKILFLISQIEQSIKIAQRIKFEKNYENVSKPEEKYEIKYTFPKYQLVDRTNKEIKQKDEYKIPVKQTNSVFSHAHKKSQTTTNITSRTPSAHKQDFESTKVFRRFKQSSQSSQFFSQISSIQRPTTGYNRRSIKLKSNLKSVERCQTSRSKNKIEKAEQKQQKLQEETLQGKGIKNMRIHTSKSEKDHRQKSQSKLKQYKKSREQSIYSIRHESHRQKSLEKKLSSMEESKFFVKSSSRRRPMRLGDSSSRGSKYHLNNENSYQQFSQKIIDKNPKISENLHIRDNQMANGSKRFKSHQNLNFIASPIKKSKRFKDNLSYKKKLYIFEGKKLLKIPELNQNVEQVYDAKKPQVLYIKAPKQNCTQWRQYENLAQLRPSTTPSHHPKIKKRRMNIMMDINKQIIQMTDIGDSFDKEYRGELIQIQQFKVQMQEINDIRKEFVKTRSQNQFTCFNDKENSVFFIEQGLLSHKANMQFQKYLKQLKESYGDYMKQPFSIQTEIIERKNEKLMQLERYFTFKAQQEWIKNNIYGPKCSDEFLQSQLEVEPLSNF